MFTKFYILDNIDSSTIYNTTELETVQMAINDRTSW